MEPTVDTPPQSCQINSAMYLNCYALLLANFYNSESIIFLYISFS